MDGGTEGHRVVLKEGTTDGIMELVGNREVLREGRDVGTLEGEDEGTMEGAVDNLNDGKQVGIFDDGLFDGRTEGREEGLRLGHAEEGPLVE